MLSVCGAIVQHLPCLNQAGRRQHRSCQSDGYIEIRQTYNKNLPKPPFVDQWVCQIPHTLSAETTWLAAGGSLEFGTFFNTIISLIMYQGYYILTTKYVIQHISVGRGRAAGDLALLWLNTPIIPKTHRTERCLCKQGRVLSCQRGNHEFSLSAKRGMKSFCFP